MIKLSNHKKKLFEVSINFFVQQNHTKCFCLDSLPVVLATIRFDVQGDISESDAIWST